MNKTFKLLIIVIAVSINVYTKAANAAAAIAVDACYCKWKLVSGNITNNATSTLMGVRAKLKLNAVYLGLGYHVSKPEFDDPVQVGGSAGTNRELDFTEADVTLGFYFDRYFSAYLGYKKLDLDYGNSLSATAPGLGVLGKFTFTNNWLVFANATYYKGDFSQEDNKGDAEITELVAGTALRLSLYSHLDLSYKIQKTEFKSSNTDNASLDIQGIALSYSYVFW